ncbi:MFS transporter [Paenibacillus hubeiensis]|uniref:MFS transporter n=1 Tax=Paenibacillus hubeiensis TaxID=3077330 RepID=UPI0031BB12FC
MLISSGPVIAANIPAIAKAFPGISLTHVGLLTTIPSLFVILGVLIGNRLEQVIGKKVTILTGLGLVLIAGIFPALYHEHFSLLFVSRCLFGLGIGLFNRLIIQMISDMYRENPSKQATVIGLESAFEGLGGICLTLLVGQLLPMGWHTSFCVYGLALPVFIAFLCFIPSDRRGLNENKKQQLTTHSDHTLDKKSLQVMIGFGVLLFLIVMIFINYNIQITPLLLEQKIGNATNGSNMLAFLGLGAFIAGFSFGKIYKIFGHYIVASSMMLLGGAMLVTTVSQSIILTTFCSMVIGFSFRCIMPYLLHIFARQIARMAKLGTTIVLISYNLGATLSPYEGSLIKEMLHLSDVQDLVSSNAIIVMIISIGGFGVTAFYHKDLKEQKTKN